MNELTFLQAKKAKADILALLKSHDLKFDISCDHKLMRYVITLIKEVNNREYKISFFSRCIERRPEMHNDYSCILVFVQYVCNFPQQVKIL